MRRIVCRTTTCPAGTISTGSYGADDKHADPRTDFRHLGTARTRSYDMDAASTLFQRHERGIHVVSEEPEQRSLVSRGAR